MPYGERFRKHRKWLQDAFVSKAALASYLPIQRRETYTLLAGLCDSPKLFMDHVKRYVTTSRGSIRCLDITPIALLAPILSVWHSGGQRR